MTPIHLIVPVLPVPKARARTVRDKRGNTHTFTPERTVAAEDTIGDYYRATYPGRKPWPAGVALAVWVFVVLPRPKSAPKGRVYPVVRPDVDNFCKTVLDACNGLVWADDCQVIEVSGRKAYGSPERWEINVREV